MHSTLVVLHANLKLATSCKVLHLIRSHVTLSEHVATIEAQAAVPSLSMDTI